jgi:succinate dehydrogenase / fumarate reductase flavoprotein subunit
LHKADEMLVTLLDRAKRLNLSDRSQWANQTLAFCRELSNMLHVARVIVQGAEARNESRGSHYKPDFPDRNDADWMKTTMAAFDPAASAPVLSYQPVDAGLIPPRTRKY